MRSRRLLATAVIVGLALAGAAWAQDGGQETPEARLVAAELQELSRGDLDGAKKGYEALAEDEAAPAAARARAMLGLGRIARKRGELDQARKTLQDLLARFPKEEATAKEARSFLDELVRGRAASEAFDWLGELERNPEIQARVFDLAMDLASPDDDKRKNARLQLSALGTVADPVLERVYQVSRNREHRQEIALVEVRGGRLERLGALFEEHDPSRAAEAMKAFEGFLRVLPRASEEERRAFLAALDGVPHEGPAGKLWLAARLWAGDRSDLEGKLQALCEVALRNGLLQHLLEADAEAAGPAAVSLLAEGVLPSKSRQELFFLLGQKAPASIPPESWEMVLQSPGLSSGLIQNTVADLAERRDFDVLARVARAAPAARNAIQQTFDRHAWEWVQDPTPSEAEIVQGLKGVSPEWGRVLRAANLGALLRLLAQVQPSAAQEYADAFKTMSDDGSSGLLSFEDYVRVKNSNLRDISSPAPEFLEAMKSVLDSPSILARVAALEQLGNVPRESDPELFGRIASLVRSADDNVLREFGLRALVRVFGDSGDPAEDVAAVFLSELGRRATLGAFPPDYWRSPAVEARFQCSQNPFGWVLPSQTDGATVPALSRVRPGVPGRGVGRSKSIIPGMDTGAAERFETTLLWTLPQNLTSRAKLSMALVSGCTGRAGAAILSLLRACLLTLPKEDDRLVQALSGELDRITDSEAVLAAQDLIILYLLRPREQAPEYTRKLSIQGIEALRADRLTSADLRAVVIRFLTRVAKDPALPLPDRCQAFYWAWPESFDAFDWPAVLAGTDPLASAVPWGVVPFDDEPDPPPTRQNSSGPDAERYEAFGGRANARQPGAYRAAAESPQPSVRSWAMSSCPTQGDEGLALLKKGLGDPDLVVRLGARNRILRLTQASAAPLIVQLLHDEDQGTRLKALEVIPRFASEASLPPLVALLEDPDVGIRSMALDALREVRRRIAETEEWQAILKALPGAKEGAGTPSPPAPGDEKKG